MPHRQTVPRYVSPIRRSHNETAIAAILALSSLAVLCCHIGRILVGGEYRFRRFCFFKLLI